MSYCSECAALLRENTALLRRLARAEALLREVREQPPEFDDARIDWVPTQMDRVLLNEIDDFLHNFEVPHGR